MRLLQPADPKDMVVTFKTLYVIRGQVALSGDELQNTKRTLLVPQRALFDKVSKEFHRCLWVHASRGRSQLQR